MNNKKEHIVKRPDKQGPEKVNAEPNKIGASTPYDFEAKTSRAGLILQQLSDDELDRRISQFKPT